MRKTILLPLDGSATAALAIPFAEGIARAAGARVVLIRSVRQAKIGELGTDPFEEPIAAEAEAELNVVAERLRAGGLEVEARVSDSDAGEAIVQGAAEVEADLIVMSTHGRSGLRRVMYGSVADQVLRMTAVPVLLVPPTAQYRMNPPCRIVVALDGSQLAEAAIAPAFELAEGLRGSITLVRATESPTYWRTEGEAADRVADSGSEADLARQYLETVADQWKSKSVDVSGYVTDGAADEAIAEAARVGRAGAVAMATHGRTGLARMVTGSVTERVLHEVSVPLLLVHPDREEQRAGRTVSAGASRNPASG
jgi:nucleotide-binding universal stress UspA family protein